MKSIRRAEYRIYCDLLRELREDAGLRQSDLAKALGVPQAYVSAYEMGKTRLDFVQIRDWCEGCNRTLADLVALFEEVWKLSEPARLERANRRDEQRAAEKAALAAAQARPKRVASVLTPEQRRKLFFPDETAARGPKRSVNAGAPATRLTVPNRVAASPSPPTAKQPALGAGVPKNQTAPTAATAAAAVKTAAAKKTTRKTAAS